MYAIIYRIMKLASELTLSVDAGFVLVILHFGPKALRWYAVTGVHDCKQSQVHPQQRPVPVLVPQHEFLASLPKQKTFKYSCFAHHIHLHQQTSVSYCSARRTAWPSSVFASASIFFNLLWECRRSAIS